MLDRLPVRPELERRLERLFVAVGRRVAYIHPVARMDRPAPQFGFGGGATHEMLGRRDPAQRLLDEDRDDGRIGAQCIQMLRLFEIGRASCRERVCQYVYIQVVDGYLKKKTK